MDRRLIELDSIRFFFFFLKIKLLRLELEGWGRKGVLG